jgi:hypothetical protein
MGQFGNSSYMLLEQWTDKLKHMNHVLGKNFMAQTEKGDLAVFIIRGALLNKT